MTDLTPRPEAQPMTAAELKANSDLFKLATKEVLVPEWNRTVTIRKMTGTEMDVWEEWMDKTRENDGTNGLVPMRLMRPKLICMVVTDADGKPLLTPEDVARLSKDIVVRLWTEALEFNVMSPKAQEEQKKS